MACKICSYSRRDVSSKLFVIEVNEMLLRGERYSNIMAIWKYHNRFEKKKRFKTISKWSLSKHRNNCLSSLSEINHGDLKTTKGSKIPERRVGIKQGEYLYSGWFIRCKECGFILDGEGFDKQLRFWEHICVLSRKIPVFTVVGTSWKEVCPKCNGGLKFSSKGSSFGILRKKKRSLWDRGLDSLAKLL